jgi:hypothetical protein
LQSHDEPIRSLHLGSRRSVPTVERVAALPDEHLDLPPLLFRHVLAPALGAAKRLLPSAKFTGIPGE